MEHCCCIEFLNIQEKLVFDGSIENLDCIIRHEAVLENVAPLLRCKNRLYRRRSGVTHNVKKTVQSGQTANDSSC